MFNQSTHKEKYILLAFFILNIFLKLSFFNINLAEYTDGIIQIIQHKLSIPSYWPPMYNWLTRAISTLGLSLEASAKIVSIISSSLLIVPLYYLTRMLADNQQKPAIFAVLIYTLSPIHLRWSVRVMSDSLFSFFNFCAIYYLFLLFEYRTHTYYFLKYALYTNIFLILANLTRFQGLLLVPFFFYILYIVFYNFIKRIKNWDKISKIFKKKIIKYSPFLIISFIPWIFYLPYLAEKIHLHLLQFHNREAHSILSTLANYFIYFDEFLGHIPYFFNYIVVGFAIIGFVKLDSRKIKIQIFKLFILYYLFSLLLLQSAFQSFQERYLLPFLPFVSTLSGIGIFLSLYELSPKTQPGIKYYQMRKSFFYPLYIFLIIIGIFTMTITTIGIMTYQSQTFASIKDVALFLKKCKTKGNIYSNEIYNNNLKTIKISFWSGKKIKYFSPHNLPKFKKGDIICIHSIYAGKEYFPTINRILKLYNVRTLYSTVRYRIIPIFPDVMSLSIANQNPIWATFRFKPQYFESIVLEVE